MLPAGISFAGLLFNNDIICIVTGARSFEDPL